MIGVFTRFGLSPEDGAKTNIYLASSPDVEGVTGKYYENAKPFLPRSRPMMKMHNANCGR